MEPSVNLDELQKKLLLSLQEMKNAAAAGANGAESGTQGQLHLTPGELDWISARGVELAGQGRYEDAKTIFKGLWAFTDHSFFAYTLGKVACEERDFSEALHYFNIAANDNPKLPQIFAERALVLFELKRGEEAMRDIRRAIELDTNQSDPVVKFAQAILKAKEEEAMAAEGGKNAKR